MSLVRFIERMEAFHLSPALASWVADWQKSSFVIEEHLFEEGEEIWCTEADKAVTLTAEEAEKINAEKRAEFDRLLDPFPLMPQAPPNEGEIIAEPACRSMRGVAGAMKRHMTSFAAQMGIDELIILPAVRASILSQDNDYGPVARATATLKLHGFDRSETLAAIGPVDEMAALLGPLFWIARCNASAPYIVLGAPGLPLVGILCQYANFHFTIMDKRRKIIGALRKSHFYIPRDGMCRERFVGTGAMPGRRIEL